jgi:hypothetical protein
VNRAGGHPPAGGLKCSADLSVLLGHHITWPARRGTTGNEGVGDGRRRRFRPHGTLTEPDKAVKLAAPDVHPVVEADDDDPTVLQVVVELPLSERRAKVRTSLSLGQQIVPTTSGVAVIAMRPSKESRTTMGCAS